MKEVYYSLNVTFFFTFDFLFFLVFKNFVFDVLLDDKNNVFPFLLVAITLDFDFFFNFNFFDFHLVFVMNFTFFDFDFDNFKIYFDLVVFFKIVISENDVNFFNDYLLDVSKNKVHFKF